MKKSLVFFMIIFMTIIIIMVLSTSVMETVSANGYLQESILYPSLSLDNNQIVDSVDYTIDFTADTQTPWRTQGAEFTAEYSIHSFDESAVQLALPINSRFINLSSEVKAFCNDEELQSSLRFLPCEKCDPRQAKSEDILEIADERHMGFGEEKGILYTLDLADVPSKKNLIFEFDMDNDTKYIYSNSNSYNKLDNGNETKVKITFTSREKGGDDRAYVFFIGEDIRNIQTYYYNNFLQPKRHVSNCVTREEILIDDYISNMSDCDGDFSSPSLQEELFITRATALKEFLESDEAQYEYNLLDNPMRNQPFCLYHLYDATLSQWDNKLTISYPLFSNGHEDIYYSPEVYTYTKAELLSESMTSYSENSLRIFPNSETPYMLNNENWNKEDGNYVYATQDLPSYVNLSFCASQEPVDLGHPSSDGWQNEGSGYLVLFVAGIVIMAIILIVIILIIVFVVRVIKMR